MPRMLPIEGHPGYHIGDDGSVFSERAKRMLKPYLDGVGYPSLRLGRGKPESVHRLVAAAFISNPEGKAHVNHKDGDRTNNDRSNLEWATPSENHLHAHRSLGRKPHPLCRPVMVGGEIVFENVKDAARHLGAPPSNIQAAAERNGNCKGKEIRYVG